MERGDDAAPGPWRRETRAGGKPPRPSPLRPRARAGLTLLAVPGYCSVGVILQEDQGIPRPYGHAALRHASQRAANGGGGGGGKGGGASVARRNAEGNARDGWRGNYVGAAAGVKTTPGVGVSGSAAHGDGDGDGGGGGDCCGGPPPAAGRLGGKVAVRLDHV